MHIRRRPGRWCKHPYRAFNDLNPKLQTLLQRWVVFGYMLISRARQIIGINACATSETPTHAAGVSAEAISKRKYETSPKGNRRNHDPLMKWVQVWNLQLNLLRKVFSILSRNLRVSESRDKSELTPRTCTQWQAHKRPVKGSVGNI